MQENLILYSSIRPQLLQSTLLKGFKWALIGGLIILFSGALIGPEILKKGGFIIFLLGMSLITRGLLPYRRLTRLACKPNTIMAHGFHELIFTSKGQCPVCIPLKIIEKLSYMEKADNYGIAIWLKPSFFPLSNVSPFKLPNFQYRQKKEFESDLFLAYFSKTAYQELSEWLSNESDSTLDDVV